MADSRNVFALLQLDLPLRPRRNVGVLLFDPLKDKVYPKLRSDWADVAGDEADVFEHLPSDLRAKARELSGSEFLRQMEDSLSHVLLISEREPAGARSLERLFEEFVEPPKVVPFVTHLPLYSLLAAASKFGGDMEVEAEDWLPGPAGLRLTGKMFVARVAGRSMEPVIPDGSLCVFRADVVGSRSGRRVLVRAEGTSESGGEFTVKRYRRIGDSIRLEPLNPEFPAIVLTPEEASRRYRVIAEFVQVLE